MTVKEKLEALKKYCRGHICTTCPLGKMCWKAGENSTPLTPDITDDKISIMYSTLLQYMNGGSTMEKTTMNVAQTKAKTIEIELSEYRFLISEQSTLSKLEGYAETHEYLSDDVVRALLGVEKPNPARIESEGE